MRVGRGGFSDVSAGTPTTRTLGAGSQWRCGEEAEGEEVGEASALTNQGATIVWKSKSSKVCTVKKRAGCGQVEGRDLQAHCERPSDRSCSADARDCFPP